MQGEIIGPHEEDGTPPGEGDSKRPLMNLKDYAERFPLYEELYAVLQNVVAIRYPEADPEEKEAVKRLTSSDTRELTLPKIATGPRSRVKQREEEDRKERNVRDALKRFGSRPS